MSGVPAKMKSASCWAPSTVRNSAISAFVDGPGRAFFDAIARFDKGVVDGAVNGVGSLVGEGSLRARVTQSGLLRQYALGLAVGVLVVAGLVLSNAAF